MQTEIQMEDVELQKEQNNENTNETEELDMEKYGDMSMSSGGNKPEFTKITPATITAAKLKVAKGKEDYQQVFLAVTFKYTDAEGNEKETWENFGGARLYPDKLWCGEESALGKLRKVVKQHFEFHGKPKELVELLLNKRCGVISEKGKVAGKEYMKTTIAQFMG